MKTAAPSQPICSSVCFELANETDDSALRAVLRHTPMDGSIRLTMRREPSFFRVLAAEGPFYQALIARERSSGRVIGIGTRSVRERYVDGVPTPIGYLSALRVLPDRRGGTVLARGYRFLKELHGDGRTQWYLTSIASGNTNALQALSGSRAGLPTYRHLGRYVTWVLPRRTVVRRESPYSIRCLIEADLPTLLDFIAQSTRHRQFIPCYSADDFRDGSPTFPGLGVSSIFGAWRDGRLCATLAAWDQRAFRQNVVEGYSGALRAARHIHNALASLRRLPRFPSSGQCVPMVTAALALADEHETAGFAQLVDIVAMNLPTTAEGILVGLSEQDPLTKIVRRRAITHFATEIFAVSWETEEIRPARFPGGVPYMELGSL